MDDSPAQIQPSSSLIRAEGLWFEDCGLIIQAERMIFRISRDFLAMQSPVFSDMLSLPTPKDADMMEGCPFVLLPDSASDVTVFLKALVHYDFFQPLPAPTTLPILTGVLRMSHKYEVDALRRRAISHISHFYPMTLHEYDQLDRKSDPWFTQPPMQHANAGLGLLHLARQLSLDWILPAVFYGVCDIIEDVIIDWEELEVKDKSRWMVGIRRLETYGVNRVLDCLWKPFEIDGCSSRRTCTQARGTLRRELEDRRERPLSSEVPFLPFEIWSEQDWPRLHVCHTCLSNMKVTHEVARKALWAELPAIFELPDWSELEKLRAEALE
ncbi:hypothetical protein C8R43DRAFT_676404 [Mycena crocata]|nr:hypothetical protein C8R43DRAFT_676404 [Mycena crocata]